MFLSVRARILAWLLIVLFPVVAASVIAIQIVDRDLSARIVTDLENVRRLEAARIDQVLATYSGEARVFADDRHVVDFTTAIDRDRTGARDPDDVIGGYDGFAAVDPTSPLPLQPIADAIKSKSRTTASRAVEFRILGYDGEILGETAGFTWEPYRPSTVTEVLASGQSRFGNAFRNVDGRDRIGHVAPIQTSGGEVVGALMVEMQLGPITDFLLEHEGFGATTEAHLAQPTPTGDAEHISPLRFERDAAFSKTVPKASAKPINESLVSPAGTTFIADDYRGSESILSVETIRDTGWGLVVKIDRAEALSALDRIRWVIALAGAAAAAGVLAGWALFLGPLVARLRRASAEARNVAAGDHAPIGDRRRDEIGDMARTIDQLADDLATDRKLRAEYERELVRHARHDDLTGLVNRQHASRLVGEMLEHDESVSSLLFIDLDGFKSINDTYGHLIGDEVLVAVANRLMRIDADEAIVSRWGGDEFVVLLPGVDVDGAKAFAEQARAAFEEPIGTSVGPQLVRWSLGTATTEGGRNLDQLLVDADRRMFEEKQARKGRAAVSSSTLRDIETALVEDRIEAFLQPIVDVDDIDSPRLWGAEALVRLRQPDGTIITPAKFLAAAQDNHLGAAIDECVGRKAIEQVGRWMRDGVVDTDFRLSINVCEASSRDPQLVDRLGVALERAGLAPSGVTIEISEETRHIDPESLRRLRALGVALAVDDVGVGRSGVSRLIDTAADIGKIDGRWVNETLPGSRAGAVPVVTQLNGLCEMLDVIVVVEGVETRAQCELLQSLGITRMQGFLFGRPMPPSEFEAAWAITPRPDADLVVGPV